MQTSKIHLKQIKNFPKKKRKWKRKSDEIIYENPKFARIQAVIVVCEKNKSCYDTIVFIEPSVNAIIVAVDEEEKIYLHFQKRPSVMKDTHHIILPNNLNIDIKKLGRPSREVPRGGFDKDRDEDPRDAAKYELEEETGIVKDKKDFEGIGKINFNTAYVVSNIPVYMVKVNKGRDTKKPAREPSEKIWGGSWFSKKEIEKMIKNKEIFCAVTLAALNLAFQHLENKK